MKRHVLLAICSIIIIASGCSSKESNVFYVMFNNINGLNNSSVYYNDVEIGKILSRQSGFNGIVEVKIQINNEHIKKMTDNVVFYISNGKLEYKTIQGAGVLLPDNAAILGFNSKLYISLFKIKNVLKNVSLEASAKAMELREKIRWVDLKELT